MSLGPAIDPAALFDRCIVGTKARLPWGLLLLLLVREFRVSHAMRSAPNLQPSPVHLMSPTTLEVLSRLFVHLWHPSDPSRSQELQQNAVFSSQALELARALIPQDSATDCVVLIYGQMAISHTWPSMCPASVGFASNNES